MTNLCREMREGGNLEGDEDGWLTEWKGNRVRRIVSWPGEDSFAPYILERISG